MEKERDQRLQTGRKKFVEAFHSVYSCSQSLIFIPTIYT